MSEPLRGRRHAYGPRVHVSGNAWLHTAIARISADGLGYVELSRLVRDAYGVLAAWAFGRELPTVEREVATRMATSHPDSGVLRAQLLDPANRVVVVDVIRGGIVPSQACFEMLAGALPLEALRLDHLNMSRTSDADGAVTGVDLSGSKIGGSVEGATLVFPDPMGATGSTLRGALTYYLERYGRPRRVLAVPLIATPEFLRAALDLDPELHVYAGRIDRGLSSSEVLQSLPGERWDEERGLDARGYIVPGAGGFGEVMNNSWC